MMVTLTNSDWDARIGGWKSDALDIPGAKVRSLFHSEGQTDPRHYKVEGGVIYWANGSKPNEIVVDIHLTQQLEPIEAKKLALAKQQFNLERKWKVLTPVGVTLSALLSFVFAWALQQQKLDTEKEKPGAPTTIVPQVEPEVASKLPAASSDKDFDLLRDLSVFDLRTWKPVPPEQSDTRHSPVNYINYLHIRKKSGTNKYIAHYSTSGFAIDLRCVTHKWKVITTQKAEHPGEKTFSVEVDVQQEFPGSEFLLVIEATYWNGFSDPTRSSALTYTDNDISALGELALVVLFPDKKPFQSYELLTGDSAGTFSPYTSDQRLYADQGKRFIYWSIKGRAPNAHYKIDWSW